VGEGPQKGGRGPDRGVGANVKDPLKVACPGRLLGRAAENGVLEPLRGAQTTGAGGGGVAVPRGVGAEVAIPRSHLVEAGRGELVQAHKRVGF